MRTPTGETSFSLAFGIEAMIPVEIGMATHRTTNFDSEKNEEGLRNNLNLLKERRDKATLWIAAYNQKIAKYYNSRVKTRRFTIGDLVLRKVRLSTQDLIEGKLRSS